MNYSQLIANRLLLILALANLMDFMGMSSNKFNAALSTEQPLRIIGTPNPLYAKLAEQIGFKALYCSGANLANCDLGLPDVGINSLVEVVTKARNITSVTNLPLLVDIDTGFGNLGQLQRAIKLLIQADVAAIHIEDQDDSMKKCGHLSNKKIVPSSIMQERIKTAVDARQDKNLIIMARSDSLANEGLAAMIKRLQEYVTAGADMVFAEAVTDISQYKTITNELKVPVLANSTEFGVTPFYSCNELKQAGIAMVLYPLTIQRTMNFAAQQVMQTIYAANQKDTPQQELLIQMQTRQELYDLLGYGG